MNKPSLIAFVAAAVAEWLASHERQAKKVKTRNTGPPIPRHHYLSGGARQAKRRKLNRRNGFMGRTV